MLTPLRFVFSVSLIAASVASLDSFFERKYVGEAYSLAYPTMKAIEEGVYSTPKDPRVIVSDGGAIVVSAKREVKFVPDVVDSDVPSWTISVVNRDHVIVEWVKYKVIST